MEFKFHSQVEINKEQLDKIINLKMIHWDYSSIDHYTWIKNNIKPEDIHVLMFDDGVLMGYLNLIQISIVIDSETHSFFGIGNVCSKDKGKGYGSFLIKEINNYLTKNNRKGILLCKDILIDFYLKYDWQLLDNQKVKASFELSKINIMVYNMDVEIIENNIFIENQF